MIKKLQLKFIMVALLSALLVLIIAILPMDIYVYFNTNFRLHQIVNMICDNNGYLPDYDRKMFVDIDITQESRNEIRYFSVIVSDNSVVELNTGRISAVSDDEASDYADEVLALTNNTNQLVKLITNDSKEGVFEKNDFVYYYKVKELSDGSTLVVFVDGTSSMKNSDLIIKFSVMLLCICFLLFLLLVKIFSKRAIKSFVENYNKQKAFITNASHELKTPLSIISANNDISIALEGENEWNQEIKNQVKEMTNNINDLVALAKADEQKEFIKEKFDFSEVVTGYAESFKTVAKSLDKSFESDIAEGIILNSDKKGLSRVVSVLMDNAVKYCDDNGKIKVVLKNKGKKACLSVSNTYVNGKNEDYKRFFDRFYRADESHNSEKKGFGIGLSLAESTVQNCKGKIGVSYSNEEITFFVTL
ncbi:MAG: HAMP domain-containing histidine kinase [Lachnospiraceae bacterium]|nr:HAMP domain-containing histidine kinase [Lachnospiraceae bacterium]